MHNVAFTYRQAGAQHRTGCDAPLPLVARPAGLHGGGAGSPNSLPRGGDCGWQAAYKGCAGLRYETNTE